MSTGLTEHTEKKMDRNSYSVYLSKALDALGYSYETIKYRQKSWELCGEGLTADEAENITDILAGSKAEGVSRLFEGDYDMMVSLNDFICYRSLDDIENDSIKDNVLKEENEEILTETTVILYQRADINDKSHQITNCEDHARTDSTEGKTARTELENDCDSTKEGSLGTDSENSDEENTINYDGKFLMDTEHVSPGYTKLKVIQLDEKNILETDSLEKKAVVYAKVERNGDSVLSSECFAQKAYECDEDDYNETVAGPAGRSLADEDYGSVCDVDSVYCIPCVCKHINKSWANRKRNFDWPSKELVEEISRLDGHVVPVGFKGSETSNMEWRICYTRSEIKLIQSFNETQIKLHALVKIVGKHLLQPKCPDITSYILKNLLLWMAEKIPAERFEIENLYGLLMMALKFLRHVIHKRNLLNYMIPERNLFLGKLQEDERNDVLEVLDEIVTHKQYFIERYEELEFLSKHIHIAANEPGLVEYMEMSRLQLEVVFRQNWREVWEDRVYNFVSACLKYCLCMKSLVSLCDMLGVSSETKELVVEKLFWWITGRKTENDEDGSTSGNAYWQWDENGDILPVYPANYCSTAEELESFFRENKIESDKEVS